ncbi:hypothetical protein LSTR_LSTR013378 [Laodelphax striatellus]|uniref:Uncharacterized protein n=1 Tax=Laodelphax striatellus TaxID=195883 RepID=A0A482WRI8_LAOST|nr:hypothetical protein LSTR_LSTR013378 [Laodelphax striatellus]
MKSESQPNEHHFHSIGNTFSKMVNFQIKIRRLKHTTLNTMRNGTVVELILLVWLKSERKITGKSISEEQDERRKTKATDWASVVRVSWITASYGSIVETSALLSLVGKYFMISTAHDFHVRGW